MSQLHSISGCSNNERKADVIFIHGLGGDAFKTWCNGTDQTDSWPHWLGQTYPDVGVWSLDYAASPTKWTRNLNPFLTSRRDDGYSMALPDRALQVLDLMVQRSFGKRPIMFICHSLGGLLAKQILRKAVDATDERKKRIASQTRAVLFLATPHAGAALASLLDSLSTIFGATVSIEDLRAHDAHLRDLFDWYRNHAPGLDIKTVTYYETRSIRGIVPIVNSTSSHPGVGADPVGLDEDHISIAKPRKKQSQVCGAAIDLIHNHVLASGPIPPRETRRNPRVEEEKDHSADPYTILNDDREIRDVVSNNIHKILDNEKMRCIEKALWSRIERKGAETVTRVSDRLVNLPVLDSLIQLEEAVKECIDPLKIQVSNKDDLRLQWQASVDILGWLLLLSVSSKWRTKHKSLFEINKTMNFRLSVTKKSSADIAVSSLVEKPVGLSDNKSRGFDKACDFGVELGINKTDSVEMITIALYRALFEIDGPVESDYLSKLKAKLKGYNVRNQHRYIAVDISNAQNPLNNPDIYTQLITSLPELNLIYIGVKDTDLDVLLIPEHDVLENIERFLEIKPTIGGA